MIKKFPLLRGKGRNKSLQQEFLVVSLSDLAKIEEGDVTVESLYKYKIIKKEDLNKPIKILAKGTIKKALTITLPTSQSALKKIEAAGGKVL